MAKTKASDSPRVRSVRLSSYRACLDRLPTAVRELAEDKYKNYFRANPRHPLLEGYWYKSRIDDRRVYKVNIGNRHRALAFVEGGGNGSETFVWYWIGSHEEYNGLKNRTLIS